MKRSITMLVVCASLLLASGCGSSKEARSASRAASGATGGSAPASTPTEGAGAGAEVFGEPGETSSQAARPSGPVAEIAYRDVAISPANTTVKVGTTLIWTNHDSVEHNVTSQSGPAKFASHNLREGETFRVKLSKPGVIHYLCTIHPASMNGTIEVVR